MSYEFSATENEIIRKAGSRTKIWGILTLAGGILTALMGLAAAMSGETFGIVAGVIYALLALIPIIIGRSFMEAGNALGAAVTTAGSDIDHLMTALTGLSKAFIIQRDRKSKRPPRTERQGKAGWGFWLCKQPGMG